MNIEVVLEHVYLKDYNMLALILEKEVRIHFTGKYMNRKEFLKEINLNYKGWKQAHRKDYKFSTPKEFPIGVENYLEFYLNVFSELENYAESKFNSFLRKQQAAGS
jgi:hypothetical protein